MFRTHTCGELRISHSGKLVTLCGWVYRIRNKGGIIWVDLRDRFGITQLVIQDSNTSKETYDKVKSLDREYVISTSGIVSKRISKNDTIPTGEIEVEIKDITILNKSNTLPFSLEESINPPSQDLRMRYRYLDLRRPELQKNIILRHKVMQETRSFLNKNNFLEIETPTLVRSTPEGARDFIVPYREQKHHYYSLPQSPQLLKQLLMISGFDRYYQIVKCFRDEDLRADRQPEFTQIDCELSFVDQEEIISIFERLLTDVFKQTRDITLPPFQRMTYDQAMNSYGSDKPDLRYDMRLIDLKPALQNSNFKNFNTAENIIAICVKKSASYTRSQIDTLSEFIKQRDKSAPSLIYIKYNSENDIKSSIEKFLTQPELSTILQKTDAHPGDLILISYGEKKRLLPTMGALRTHLAKELHLTAEEVYAPVWVTDFPLLEWSEKDHRFYSMHHPFTTPKDEDIPLLEKDPHHVLAKSYDAVINGLEIGGGSIRIHSKDLQNKMLNILGFDNQKATNSFGFLLNALDYGAPPHGGIAFGLDRLCAVLSNQDSIRNFIAFPKNNSGKDTMLDAPNTVSPDQLKELGL